MSEPRTHGWPGLRITKDEAIAALEAVAFTTDEDEAPSRTIVHRMGRFTGADQDLDEAITDVRAARAAFWTPSIFAHELAIEAPDGMVWTYNAQRPDA